jgi:hypothetical protein
MCYTSNTVEAVLLFVPRPFSRIVFCIRFWDSSLSEEVLVPEMCLVACDLVNSVASFIA